MLTRVEPPRFPRGARASPAARKQSVRSGFLYQGPKQFAVTGNGPDPAKVSAKDGVVKYELVYAPVNNGGEKVELPRELRGVQGVLLVQVLDGRKLKAEAFPGKSAKDVTGFTKDAAVFER